MRKSLAATILLVCIWQTLQAQPQLHPKVFGTREGLPSPKVYSLYQAANRLLYVGTELGLSAFDGKSFSNFPYTSSNTWVGRILAIAEDGNHRIWFGGDNGLFLLQNGEVQQVKAGKPISVESMLVDSAGRLWVGELNALYRLEKTQLERLSLPHLPIAWPPAYQHFTERIFSLAANNEGQVFAGIMGAIVRFSGAQPETIWRGQSLQPVKSMVAGDNGSLVAATITEKPFSLSGTATQIINTPYLIRGMAKRLASTYLFTSSNIVALTPDGPLVLAQYDSLIHHVHNGLIDAEGNFWLATWDGLWQYKHAAFRQHAIAGPNINAEIFSMLEMPGNDLLFGGNNGTVFRLQEGVLQRDNQLSPFFSLAEVLTLQMAPDGAIWAGSGYQGISRYKDGRVQNWLPGGNLRDNNCEMLLPLADGSFLACTEDGITVVDPLKPTPFVEHYSYNATFSRLPELFGALHTDGQTWGYGSSGIFRVNKGKLFADTITGADIAKPYISQMIADGGGHIWVATMGSGLWQCRQVNGTLQLERKFITADGMPSNMILAIVEDNLGNIWAADYAGLTRLAPDATRYRITRYNQADGLAGDYYAQAKLAKQHNGRIWMMTNAGVASFYPDSIGLNTQPPGLVWRSISVMANNNSLLRNLSADTAYTLAYDQNNLKLQFTGICLTDPYKLLYAYRLIGADTNWVMQESSEINLRFIPAGQYMLELKAANNSGIWTKVPLRFSFTINRPWWQKQWFLVVTGLLLTTLLAAIIRMRDKRINMKADLQQHMAELEAKAIRAQMNPHFIFNSLNAIQESIVLQDMDTAYTYLSKFSKLLRMVLELSEHNMIPLSSELEMNALYLDLESLRFRGNFHYQLLADDIEDTHDLMFPSLLIQPIIENAIWHGLMLKEGEKKLTVRYAINDNHIVCTIDDNGIGRERAAAIKKQKLGANFFASKALTMVKQRIALLKQSGTTNATFYITDKTDADGMPAGTLVNISVPLLNQQNSSHD